MFGRIEALGRLKIHARQVMPGKIGGPSTSVIGFLWGTRTSVRKCFCGPKSSGEKTCFGTGSKSSGCSCKLNEHDTQK